MRRIAGLLAAMLLLLSFACAEDALTLRTATSIEEVEQFLLLPPEGGVSEAERGYIRYIAQKQWGESAFRKEYWLGGEEGSILDLTVRKRNGYEFPFHAGTMCTRAVYSMAMSYFGIDVTPGNMSAITGDRNIDEPYDDFSKRIGVERVTYKSKVFNRMMENYLTDDSYSPIYLYIQKPSGSYHSLLVVAYMPDVSRYIVVDSSPYTVDDVPQRVYFISLNKNRTEIINSTFRWELKGSKVLQVYQWHLLDEAE